MLRYHHQRQDQMQIQFLLWSEMNLCMEILHRGLVMWKQHFQQLSINAGDKISIESVAITSETPFSKCNSVYTKNYPCSFFIFEVFLIQVKSNEFLTFINSKS